MLLLASFEQSRRSRTFVRGDQIYAPTGIVKSMLWPCECSEAVQQLEQEVRTEFRPRAEKLRLEVTAW
jgi:hypothetical protein